LKVGLLVKKIISGGQTGADRAALDFAIANGIPHGGWCPRGRLAEDEAIDARYELSETPSSNYAQRTEWNVRDSDATVIFSIRPWLTGGSRKTAQFARQYRKPWLQLSAQRDGRNAPKKLAEFLAKTPTAILNVAGPRASEAPRVAEFVSKILSKVIPAATTISPGSVRANVQGQRRSRKTRRQ
jgi:hypothetical protein